MVIGGKTGRLEAGLVMTTLCVAATLVSRVIGHVRTRGSPLPMWMGMLLNPR